MKFRNKLSKLSRKLHNQVAIWTAIPIFIIILSGVVLQLKKEVSWIQPPTQKGHPYQLELSPRTILEITKTSSESAVKSWKDISRLDIRPSKGIVKVRTKNSLEIQIDMSSGKILQEAYRRSDLIESIHDGSFFHDYARLWVFLPMGLLLLFLWISGVIIFINNLINKRNKMKVAR